jgi:formylmethanofuran dehydrogenase subunit C
MRGGVIKISGATRDFTGGAPPNNTLGIRGGLIYVGKKAGDRTGERMRRGILIVNGETGGYCGSNMIAGTIIVPGYCARGVGLGMGRGTILLLREPAPLPATFNDCGPATLGIVTLLSGYVKNFNRSTYLQLREINLARRFTGDLGCDGQGEVLVAIG